ncbi:MAG: RNA polymerase sigma factor [Myxococcaceae bacterium]
MPSRLWPFRRNRAAFDDAGGRSPTAAWVGLVASARAGDRASFGELHRLFSRMVHGVLLTTVPPAEAGDLVQDVFLQAMQKLASLRDDASFGSWLCQMARNRAADFHRTRQPTEELPEGLAAADGPMPPTAEAARALAAIRALPEAYRETLMMRLVEGMTGPEISERTGLTPGSVRVNLHRGMKLLREQLDLDVDHE